MPARKAAAAAREVRSARFFATPAAWRRWLERHHASAPELWVGFHRKETGKASITWPESVDEALCFGWIDGVRQRIDDTSYRIRFTARRARSNWSEVNRRRIEALIAEGRVAPSGLRAYEGRDASRAPAYSFEQQRSAALTPEDDARFRRNAAAWTFFESCPPSYRRTALWWVMSARREDTRERRLAALIADSAAGRRVAPLRRGTGK